MERSQASGLATSLQRLWRTLDDRSARQLHNVDDARRLAKRRLPGVVFDFVDGGADDEVTMRRNEAAFGAVTFRPRVATGSFDPELATTVLEEPLRLPVLLAPCGLTKLLHPDGPAGVARAAAAMGTVSVLSTMAGVPVDEVSKAARVPLWFQLYAAGGRTEADERCDLAAEAGVRVLVVTIDSPTIGNRTRDVRHGVSPPLRLNTQNAVPLGIQVLRRPRWAAQLAATGLRLASQGGPAPVTPEPGAPPVGGSAFSWDDVAHFCSRWTGKLVVKGVLTGPDARRAIDAGADGVVVSNHGGRQLDGVAATLDVLPEVVEAVGGDAAVLVDGGIRRGSHVVAALALGASAVMIGRPYLHALSVAGEVGVVRLLEVLETEMRRTMTLLGCRSVDDLCPTWLFAPRA